MSETTLIQFKNCHLVRNHQIVTDDLWVRNGKIVDPEKVFFDEKKTADTVIDCQNAIIAPGFIDIQINGGYGIDFAHNTTDTATGVSLVAKNILAHGVTSFCPTLVTSPVSTYQQVLPNIPKKAGGKHGATILGVHLEGPFISVEKKGAHPAECIKDLNEGAKTANDTYGPLDNVAIITLAPEKVGALDTIEDLSKRGITMAVGHSTANLCDGEKAVQKGSNLITHLFNAMLPFHHRDPGLVGLLTSDAIPDGRTVYFGIISDGVHTHPAALRIAFRAHPDGLILVTDAISAMGLEDGTHFIGQLAVDVRNKKAYIANTNTLCGSIAPMDECVRIFQKSTNCSLVYALEAASLHPAKCLNIEQSKGTLNYGADADFLMLGRDLSVWATWIAGECVYEKQR
ncbi:hypothetical protein HA402_003387 [Bradysia odoriphaga]|nr:hypothetical protein HA402_003387 [Bradysia odoriphaga]